MRERRAQRARARQLGTAESAGIVSEPRVQVAGSTAGDFNARAAVRLDAEASTAAIRFRAVALSLSHSGSMHFRGISIVSIFDIVIRRSVLARSTSASCACAIVLEVNRGCT